MEVPRSEVQELVATGKRPDLHFVLSFCDNMSKLLNPPGANVTVLVARTTIHTDETSNAFLMVHLLKQDGSPRIAGEDLPRVLQDNANAIGIYYLYDAPRDRDPNRYAALASTNRPAALCTRAEMAAFDRKLEESRQAELARNMKHAEAEKATVAAACSADPDPAPSRTAVRVSVLQTELVAA